MEKNEINKKEWWEKPGFGIMYQIEVRPGWVWNRNYDKFNASMLDENGNFKFDGPFCKMKKWVEFSKKVGLDYHIFEAKWHDGICYWDTKYTDWKTPEDYCKVFAEESKKNKIPFMFYYSSIFDHNPMFDDIQPLRGLTPSFIAMHSEDKEFVQNYSKKVEEIVFNLFSASKQRRGKKLPEDYEFFDDLKFHDYEYNPAKYEDYLKASVKELIDNYKPDGMWMDWYWTTEETSTYIVMDLLENEYPEVVLTYNQSISYKLGRVIKLRYAHYLCGEAHDVPLAWKIGNKYRTKKVLWELLGPAAENFDDPTSRSDPNEIIRIAAIIMASGGKYVFGLLSQMDGELFPEPAKNVEFFGTWYKSRKPLFRDAIPMTYKGKKVPGIDVNEKEFGIIGSIHEGDNLIHLINFKGKVLDVTLRFSLDKWENVDKIMLEPMKAELDFKKDGNEIIVLISEKNIDSVDTILRICSASKI